MSLSAVGHVRRALSARQYDGQDPVDLSNDYEVEEGQSLPEGMMQPDAPLVYWCGVSDTEYSNEDRRRYTAATTISVTITVPKAGEERAAAVYGRVEEWFVGAIASAAVGPAGIIRADPVMLAAVPESRVDRAGRAVLVGSVVAEREIVY